MNRLGTLIIFYFAILLIIILGILGLRRFIMPDMPYDINLSRQTVIKELRSLNRLETASFTIEKIIDAGTSGSAFRQFIVGDRLLLIAHGEVIAGFDLSKLTEDSVTLQDSETLRLTLPAPEILVATLDNEQTRVYDRRRGLLTRGDNDLESEARFAAETTIRDAACKGGILNEASKNARSQLTALFKATGYSTVIIDIPDGAC